MTYKLHVEIVAKESHKFSFRNGHMHKVILPINGYRSQVTGSTQNNFKKMCQNFREIIFFKNVFYTNNKRIFENIYRIGFCQMLFSENFKYLAF
jgi:hypothetical protein